jgi:DNA-binding NarL/FixJ family response regulator
VILLDLRLPGRSGLESIPGILDCLPDVKIIILTQSDKEEDVLRAISLGASGYLLKSAKVDEITDGIRAVMRGGAPIENQVARFLLKSLKSYLPKEDIEKALSERELEILTLLGEGLVKKEIASRLAIGYTTVDTHVSHIYQKLDVRNAPEAISKAFRLGLLRPTGD